MESSSVHGKDYGVVKNMQVVGNLMLEQEQKIFADPKYLIDASEHIFGFPLSGNGRDKGVKIFLRAW